MGTLQSKLWIHKYFHLGSITFFEKNIFLAKLFKISDQPFSWLFFPLINFSNFLKEK